MLGWGDHPANRLRATGEDQPFRATRGEDCISTGKNTGIGHLPSTSLALNPVWYLMATIACDLLCWLRLRCMDGRSARLSPEPALPVAQRRPAGPRGQRNRKIRILATLSRARELEVCFLAVFALPQRHDSTVLRPRTRARPTEPAPTRATPSTPP